MVSASSPVGVFDSGIGGLTVLKALQQELPGESYIYLGDTARLPYGTKSGDTIIRYAIQAARQLVNSGVKALVIACNTASAYALDALQHEFPDLPVFGVIEPGARAACAATGNGHIAVLSTESTARAGAYAAAMLRHNRSIRVHSIGCTLLVAFAEEGWLEGPVPVAVARKYLETLFHPGETPPDTLVLGCTHFPLLKNSIVAALDYPATLIDSGATTASFIAAELNRRHLANLSGGTTRFLATDGVDRFARVAQIFLNAPVTADMVELIEIIPV